MKHVHHLVRLRRDESGLALLEFAIAFPVLLALAMYGLDTANFALTHLRLNQVALNLADNASRVGASASQQYQQMREIDVEDVFKAAELQGEALDLKAKSRITLSSLERDSTGVQRIHWQRCFGNKTDDAYKSTYGRVTNVSGSTQTGNAGVAATSGMGPAGSKVSAPINNSGVIFVEINYRYTPMFGWLSSPSDLRYIASFIVRDSRDFRQIYATSGVTPAYCNYTQVVPT